MVYQVRFRGVGNHVGGTTSFNNADIQRARADSFGDRQLHSSETIECLEQLVDGGLAEIRIRRMRHLAVRGDLHAQGSLGSSSNAVFGGLAVYQKFATGGMLIGDFGAQTIALLANQEEQSDQDAFGSQALRASDLGSNDSFRVARASAIDAGCVFG